MAYGLKYFARYHNVYGQIKEVRFFKIDYAGPVTEWNCSQGAIDFDTGSSDKFFDNPIVTSQARIGLVFMEQYDLTEFVFDRKYFFVQVVRPDFNPELEKVEWSGWLEPWDAQRPYHKPPYEVNLTASCGLAHLSKKKYKNPDGAAKKTGLKIIQECLDIIGSELSLRISTHMYENSFTGEPERGLESFELKPRRYYDENGEGMYCDVIIADILNHFDAEIVQWDNRWVVRAIVDHATGEERTYIELPYKDHPLYGASTWPGGYQVNASNAFFKATGAIRILPPINKYRAEVNVGEQNPYFDNGDMFLWDENGLIGWDFTHMPKGDPGWEQFVINPETGQSVLKINGVSPGPYEKKRKKKLVNVLGAIAIGAVGYNIKKSTYDIEPSQWIDAAAGTISKGDKTLTISFEYSTAPNSSNIMFSIRLINTKVPGQDLWVKPGSTEAGVSQGEYVWILAPPVDPPNVIYKSTINVASNPNYPSGLVVNWGYIVTGVPAGETRKIGGVNGVIVENEDIIVSKSPNSGGDQASVGGQWKVYNLRNSEFKGTFERTITLDNLNLVSDKFADEPLPFQQVIVRFYKITNSPSKTGDWYKIFNLKGTLEGFVPSVDSGQYITTLERGSKTDEQAEAIPLISGDYNQWFTGAWTIPGSNVNTKSWRRRPGLNESLSVYRAMMLDRLCMTTRPLDVGEGEIKLLLGATNLSYLHTLVLADRGNMRMRIVRYSFNDYTRLAKVTAIQVKYEEIPASELRQDSYIAGSKALNTVPGQGDGLYPTKEDSSNGRLGVEDAPLTDQEIEESIGTGGRLGNIFEDITPLTYIVSIKSEDSVKLMDFVSEAFNELNADQEPEDMFDTTTLVLKLTYKPVWVLEVADEDLEITATAQAPQTGTYYLEYDVTDPDSGLVFPLRVPILVKPSEDFIEEWPPVLIDVPTLYFIVGVSQTREIDLSDYFDPEGMHDGTGLTAELISKPGWVSKTSIVFMNLSVTGKSTLAGTDYISFEFSDAIGRTKRFTFVLISIDKPKIKYNLIDTSTADPEILGTIPGSFPVPVKIDVKTIVTGDHDGIYIKVNRGSDEYANVLVEDEQTVNETSLASYRAFLIEDGISGVVGLYRLEFATFLSKIETVRDVLFFTLYDEAYLAKMRLELWALTKIGELLVDEVTRFKKPAFFNPKAVIDDVDHDKAILTLSYKGEVIKVTEFVTAAAEYDVYTLVPDDQPAGLYTFNVQLYEAGSIVYERQADFEILDKIPEAEAGLTLVEMIPGTANYDIIQEVPIKGLTVDLPVNGYNILAKFEGLEVDWIGIEVFDKVSNQFAEFDVTRYTKKPNYVVYSEPVTDAEVLAYDILSSKEIGSIHRAPSTQRFRFTAKLGGETGKIVSIKQADITFRIPIGPGGFSGLRFLHIGGSDSENELIDGNMPKTGGIYTLPTDGTDWTVSFRKLPTELEFDEFKVQLQKAGVVLHYQIPDGIIQNSILVTKELDNDEQAYIFGAPGVGGRTVFNPADASVNIDTPGLYKATFTLYRFGVIVGTLDTEFELVLDVDVPEVPESDCCSGNTSFTKIIGDGSSLIYLIDHMLDTLKVHVTIRKTSNDVEVFVENRASTTNQVMVTFFSAPALDSYRVIVEK